MAARRRVFAVSAQQVDPLSWFTGRSVPLAFSTGALLYGAVLVVVTWNQGGTPWLQPIALVLAVSSGAIIHFASRPMHQQMGWGIGAVAILPATLGMILSAVGYAGSEFSLVLWWAPGALALAIGGLGPYVTGRTIAVLGASAAIIATLVSVQFVHPADDAWGPVATAVIMAYPPLLGTTSTVAFSYSVVSHSLRILESPSRVVVAGRTIPDEATLRQELATIARLTARATPFLERIADAARIVPADRALAGQLARRLRDDLVTQTNLSWLDAIARESRLVVVDPDRLARRMNTVQRSALRGMLRAILDTPGTDSSSLLVDLRRAPDGATAVGVSLDMALPEGRRILHLAPYFLGLNTTVDDLIVERGALPRLSFRIPADQ